MSFIYSSFFNKAKHDFFFIDYYTQYHKNVITLKTVCRLVSQFERIPLTEDKKRAFLEEFDISMCIEHDNSYYSQMIIGQTERVIDEIRVLGPEYGFLLDIIIDFFIEGVKE